MKIYRQIFLAIIIMLLTLKGISQNIMINVLSKNNGIVKKGETIFFEVTIYNTSAIKSLPTFKIRPQISFPYTLVSIPVNGHVLPKGWTITSAKKGVITLSNGKDIIPENTSRTIFLAMKGIGIGGPSTIIGQVFFSNGNAPGDLIGSATLGDNIADNSSTSSITVIK